MKSESFVNCASCDHPIQVTIALQSIQFPDDVEPLIEFFEGRLNVVNCPVCKGRIPLGSPLIVINAELNSMIVVMPDHLRGQLEALLPEFPEGLKITYCGNYPELYQAIAPWFNNTVMPAINLILERKYFDETAEAQVDLMSPLILRVFKSQVDGSLIEPIVRFAGEADTDKHKALVKALYELTVTNLIGQLFQLSIRSRTIPELNSVIRERIPSQCITADVRFNILSDCTGMMDPWEDQDGFRKGWLREYLNAIVHSHSGSANPRGQIWASYLLCIWKLTQQQDVTLDSQFNLPTSVIRETVNFRDLWDITVAGRLGESGNPQAVMRDRQAMMKSFGFQTEFEETFTDLPFEIDAPTDNPVVSEKIGDVIVSLLLERYPFNINPDKSIELGNVAGGNVQILLNNGQKDAAIFVAKEMLKRSIQAKDHFAAVAIGARVVESLNNAQEFNLAAELVTPLMAGFEDWSIHGRLGNSKPMLLLDFFNEIGNVFRHHRDYVQALDAYMQAEKINDLNADDAGYTLRLSVFNRNRAIVYRGMGKYKKSRDLLTVEIARTPEDPTLLYNLVMLEIQTNNFAPALKRLNHIIAIINEKKGSPERAEYLLARGELKRQLDDGDAGLQDLILAYDVASAAKSNRQLRIAAAAMRFDSEQPAGREFIKKCLRILFEALGDKEHRSDPSLILTIVISIAERYLREGIARDFLWLLEPEFEWLESWEMGVPWQYDYVRGWLDHQLGEGKRGWPRFERAAEKIDARVPQGEDVSFSPSWMYDKDRFQQHLSTVAVELVRQRDLPKTDLLKTYELTNGREIAARLEMHLLPEDIVTSLFKIAEKANRSIQVFFPLIEGKTVQLCHLSSSSPSPIFVDKGQWDRDSLLRIRKQTFKALKQANPEDLAFLDAAIKPWQELSSSIGKAIAPYLDCSGHVCFLPGRDFTGLPLHLVELPDGIKLLEKTTVTFAPNFAMLCARRSLSSNNSVAVVTVTKRRDSDRFRTRALETSRELSELLRRKYQVQELTELNATAEETIKSIQQASQAIFICHGAYAGPGRGYGICVSDDHQLPPSLFPISEVPDLERFVLTWDDFEEVESCPHTVVSIACSSGLTEVVAGGTRHGLEQTLFGHGTRALISPLWDIDQESGLEWVKTFCQARIQHPQQAIEETYRETSLTLRERFPHSYFWGSFTLNGSLFLEDRQ